MIISANNVAIPVPFESKFMIRQTQKHGFSLIELLIITAILLILISLLSPALKSAVESSITIRCKNNQKLSMATIATFTDDHDSKMLSNAYRWTSATWWGWNKHFIDNGYLKGINKKGRRIGNKIYSCPKSEEEVIYNDKNVQSYGLNWEAWTKKGKLSGIGASEKVGTEYHYNYQITDRIQQPDQLIYLGDSFCEFANSKWNLISQYVRIGRLWMRHQEKANVIFLDGHSLTVDKPEFFDYISTSWTEGFYSDTYGKY